MVHTLILGAGPGGYVAAIRLAKLGHQVTVVEPEALGGTCLNWGCIPSKALIHVAGLLDQMRHAHTLGIVADNLSVQFAHTQAWKTQVIGKLTGGIAQLFKAHGITWIKGHGRLVAPFTVDITPSDESPKQTLTADAIIIATGATPIPIPGFTVDGQGIVDSRQVLELTAVPERLAVLGGGVIGLELGQLYATLGASVTIIELGPTLLPGIDTEIVSGLTRQLKKQGLRVLLNTKASHATPQANGTVSITLSTKDSPSETITVDKLLVAVGRQPNTSQLGLEAVGLTTTAKGYIPVNGQQQTALAGHYAIGDVCQPPQLAHKASKEGLLVADVIDGKPLTWDVKAMPAAVFTHPEIACVGLTEAEATATGLTVTMGKFPFAASGRALSMNDSVGFVKVVADAQTDRVLGVHMLGPHVSDLLGEAALAIEAGCTSQDIALTVHAHPSLPESLAEAAEAVHKLAIHIYQP
jgi:dihydrolipoamide dehydrogenase